MGITWLRSIRCGFNLCCLSSESSGRVSGERASAAADGDPGPEGLREDLHGWAGAWSARLGAFTGVLAGGLHHQSRSAQVSNTSFHRSEAAWQLALVSKPVRAWGGVFTVPRLSVALSTWPRDRGCLILEGSRASALQRCPQPPGVVSEEAGRAVQR